MAGINFVRRYVMSQMKKTADDGIMITLPEKSKVDLNVNITMDRLLRNGIDPDAFTNPQQVDNAINMINSRMVERAIPANSAEGREITEKLFGKQKAPVFDLEGNRIPEGSGIMGGKSIKSLMESGQVTKGARGMKKSKKVEDREMFEAANKRLTSDVDSIIKNIKSMEPMTAMKEANSVIGRKGKYKNLSPEESKKILKDTEDHIFERDIPEEDFAKGGRAGFAGGSDMGTVADSKGKTGPSKGGYQGGGTGPVERPTGGGGGNDNNNTNFVTTVPENIVKKTAINTVKNLGRRELMNTLGLAKFSNPIGIVMALKGIYDRTQNPTLTEEEAISGGITGMATGGRAGFAGGGMGRRGFLKMLAGLGGGIAAAKTGILKFAGKEPAKQVAKEVVQKSGSTPPPYFFKLAEKIKMLGDDATATTDRTIAKTLKSKDGKSTYVLEEDVATGDTIIKKVNKEGDEMITDVEIMELKKGEVVKGPDGKPVRTPDEYEEVTEANARIEGDAFNDPYYSDGIEIDDILREVDDIPVPKADGGRIPYFKGGLAALKSLMNYFAKEKGVTGSKLLSDINPKKLDSGIKNLMSKEELDILKENRTEYLKHLLNIMKSDKKFLDNNRELVEEAIAQAPIGLKEFAKEMSDSIKRNAMKENRLERLSVYDKVNPDDAIMDVEMMIKNMSTGKDKRALNATGGVARLLGE